MSITSSILDEIGWNKEESCSTQREEEIDTLHAGQLVVVWPENASKWAVLARKFGKVSPSYFLGLCSSKTSIRVQKQPMKMKWRFLELLGTYLGRMWKCTKLRRIEPFELDVQNSLNSRTKGMAVFVKSRWALWWNSFLTFGCFCESLKTCREEGENGGHG